MALVSVSNSLCGRNSSSSIPPSFNPLISGFASLVYGGRSDLSVTNSRRNGKVGKHASSRRRWPSASLVENRKRRRYVRLNASSTPESQTTGNNVDSSSGETSGLSHLESLQQITSETSLGISGEQQLEEDGEVKETEKAELSFSDLTVSQRRNIRRQNYLNQVSKRDDGPFFFAVALFVLVPPAAILGVAVGTGYIDLLP